MNPIDLDAMRERWTESGQRVDAQLDMNLDAVRALLVKRTRHAFRRHTYWQWATVTISGLVSLALVAFIAAHWGQWMYVLLASLILPMAAAFAMVGVAQLRALGRLDFDHPTVQLRAELDAIQARQVAVVKWEILLSVLLWFPMLIIPLKGVFGIDIVRGLHPSVIWVNLLLGIVFVPIGLLVAARIMRRWRDTPAMRRLLMDLAGGSWAKARAEFDVLDAGETRPIAPEVAARIGALRGRLLAASWLFGLAIGVVGLFNIMHGGQLHLVAAGVTLIIATVPQLVGASQHRRALTNFSDDERQLRQRLEAILRLRTAQARATLIALPALVLPLALVAFELLADIDLLRVLSPAGIAMWALAGVISSVATARWRCGAPGRGEHAADLITLGALSRTRAIASPASR